MSDYPRLDWTPHWRTLNDNLIELAGLLPDDKLDWIPREGEWPAPLIFAHLILARHFGPIMTPESMARIGQVPTNCQSKDGIKDELRLSWEMLARFLSDAEKLDAVHGEPDPTDLFDGHEPEQ